LQIYFVLELKLDGKKILRVFVWSNTIILGDSCSNRYDWIRFYVFKNSLILIIQSFCILFFLYSCAIPTSNGWVANAY